MVQMETRNEETKRWTIPVDEEGVLTFPDDLVETTGWKEGDLLEWIDLGNGSFSLVKIDDSDGSKQAAADAGDD